MQLVDTSILTELKASGNLPSPTGVALTILELSREENTNTEDMAVVLQGDPALAGQILKYANSASSGSRDRITSLNDALVRLGMSMVRQLCLGFSILSNARNGPCAGFDYQHYWTRSLATAVSAQALAKHVKRIAPDEAFTCGLLGNIGELALASVYPVEYAKVLDAWHDAQRASDITVRRIQQLEERKLSINHNQASATILEDWGLPESYSYAALHFEDDDWDPLPETNTHDDQGKVLARIMNVAALAADICLETGPDRHALVLQFMKLGKEFGKSEDDWIRMYDGILAEWERMGQVLDILTGNVPSMENLVRRARSADPVVKPRRRPRVELDRTTEYESDQRILANAAPQIEDETDSDRGLDILIATDSEVDARILEKVLGKAGHHLTRAADGREALSLALQKSPELILTDWLMPEMDGLELTRTLRKSEHAASTYIIVMTAQDGNDELVEAFESGINDYMVKPINHRILHARLGAAHRLIKLQEQARRDREEIRRVLAEQSILNRRLQQMALEDQLTKLPNRRAGLDYLDKEWSRSVRNSEPLLCMLLDIDHFKRVNDTYGHDAGDIVLQRTAQVMQDVMRESDVVCRFGGEEFLVICPGADVEVAKRLGDRIRSAIAKNHINTAEFDGSITVSIGVAVRGQWHTSVKDLIKQADEALYAAKEAGRNLVCIANSE